MIWTTPRTAHAVDAAALPLMSDCPSTGNVPLRLADAAVAYDYARPIAGAASIPEPVRFVIG